MKIVIIDDDNLVSLSLNTILSAQDDIEVSAVGDSGQQAVKLYEEHMPDVMLMDIRMQGMTGLEAAEKILAKYPDAKILLLTTFSDDEYIVKAISLGAKGYILKQAFESIAPALRAVNNGQTGRRKGMAAQGGVPTHPGQVAGQGPSRDQARRIERIPDIPYRAARCWAGGRRTI